jgi:release factor glutamine methyltransferase
VALSIKSERPDLVVTGSDISTDAVVVARANGERLKLDVGWSVADGVPPGDYDLVVGTLPYDDNAANSVYCPPEAYFQPDVSNFGGKIGYETIYHVVGTMRKGTRVVLQHAPYQTEIIRSLLHRPDTFGPLRYPARFTAGQVI